VDVLFVVDGCAVEADVLRILGLTSYLFNLVGVNVVYRNVALLCIDVQVILILLSHNGMAPIEKKSRIS
jgi:hypothetical protein